MLLGERIRAERINAKMTQEALADKLGITARALINYEQCKRIPPTEVIGKLSKIFAQTTDYFYSSEDIFMQEAAERFRSRGKKQAKLLIDETNGLFAGGDLNEEDKDAFFKAITEIYFESKERAKKFTPKKYLDTDRKE